MRRKKNTHIIMLETIRFVLGLSSDRGIKKKNNPVIKGLKDYSDTELQGVFIEEGVLALIENKQFFLNQRIRERDRDYFLKDSTRRTKNENFK